MRRRAFSLFCSLLLVGLGCFSNGSITYGVGSEEDSSYYIIHYNGEKHEIVVNENVKLTLASWTDESKSSVNGQYEIDTDSSIQTKDITLTVTDELTQLVEMESENFRYKLVVSNSFKVEEIKSLDNNELMTGVAENDNSVFDSSSVLQSSEDTTIGSEVVTPSVNYATNIQDMGWLNSVSNGEMSGTEGQAKRIEGIKISVDHIEELGIEYSTHVQDYGWLDYVSDGIESGTTGEGKRLEAIKIQLLGIQADHYDVYYRVHTQDYGWLGWAKNGESAGTEGLAKQLEAIEIVLVERGKLAPDSFNKPFITGPTVAYSTHVEDYSWLDFVADGAMSGTVGQAKRLEAIMIDLQNAPYSGDITFSTHVEDYGWLNPVSNGKVSGTSGQSKRMEAIRVSLTGEMAKHYDVYYRVHSQHYGWLGWAKNGESSGTEGLSKRLEAIEIVFVKKGGIAPGATNKPFVTRPTVVYSTNVETYSWLDNVADGVMSGTVGQAKRLEAIMISLEDAPYSGDITFSTHIQDNGWLDPVSNGKVSGTIGQSKRMEAIRVDLTGEMAKYYDVYYRVHAQDYGWLGWAKNGMKAGTEGRSKRLEAIEIKLVPKGRGESVSEKKAFMPPLRVFLDPGHGGHDPGAIAGGYEEADLNLAVAKKVQSLLVGRGYQVYMSRDNDTYVSLIDRPQMANHLDADIFISIHHNSTEGGATTVAGIESFYYRYNVDYPSKINGDMHNNPERIAKSVTLTNLIQNNMVDNTGAKDRGTAGQALAVVRESAMPATLLELGFINNSSERQNLVSDSYQSTLAQSIADGIDEYFNVY
ncbi:N-acetylmuramoyl-L-alanine amidase [Bacillus sp. DJP31]|uniref:N-acetylmuramoyl-L-alanine amidase n=1 Tax=Bacillus sp. DJP31 TaxID=3409789 RepID=UPI003BB72EFD